MSEFQEGEAALMQAVAGICPDGLHAACRAIRPGDETLLLPSEGASIRAEKRLARAASGAARHVARDLLNEIGVGPLAILRAPSGAPVWPEGVAGSLAHDDTFALAAIASTRHFAAIGVDVEPAEALPDEVAEIVRMACDNTGSIPPALADRLLFAAKEAVYKAVFPRDHVILGYEDIVIDLASRHGVVPSGHRMVLDFCLKPRIVVIAWERA